MVRTYLRKSNYSKYNRDNILKAVKAVKVDAKTLTKVAKEYGFKVSSLHYYLTRYKDHDFEKEKEIKALKNPNQVFSKELEDELVRQFLDATQYCIGLSPLNLRKFAYEFASHNDLELRPTWMENEMAGEDWLNSFLKRHPTISLIGGFNTHSIQMFHSNYRELLIKFQFQNSEIFKVDEIAITTAKQLNRVFARRGEKETLVSNSIKQDELMIMVSTSSANGLALPPMFIIPRQSFTDNMMDKALEGTIRIANKIKWMSKNVFLDFLRHFVKITQSDKTHPRLMILDNHSSYLSLEAIAYAKENGVVMLILPSHTFKKLQPLKETIFESFKTIVNTTCKIWVNSHPKIPMKINDILNLVEQVFPQVFTSSDIVLGFKSSGIYPYKKNIYTNKKMTPLKNEDTEDVDSLKEQSFAVDSVEDPLSHCSIEDVVSYSLKDSQTSEDITLSQIEQILGISSTPSETRKIKEEYEYSESVKLKSKKNDELTLGTSVPETNNIEERISDIIKLEQEENIEDQKINQNVTEIDSGQLNQHEESKVKSIKRVSKKRNTHTHKKVLYYNKKQKQTKQINNKKKRKDNKTNIVIKSNESELGSRMKRKTKLNSKLSDYICN